AAQTYPSDLLEVVVADDGSSPPITVPPGAPFEARVVAQVHDGFGLARARNMGAASATGEVLVFLDCDMVPEPELVEAHARWHHVNDRALTLGFRRHVDFDGITPVDLAAAGSVEAAVAGRSSTAPQWIEFHMSRTNDLTSADDDLFRIVTGGNLGVRREFFDEVGGFDGSFAQWGGEDTEMGYRAFNRGGLLVPERRALAWHQGEGASGPDPAEKRSQQEQAHRLAHLIAEKGFRKSAPGRSFEVPMVTVAVDASGRTYDDVADQVENVLASGFHDLVVGVSVPPDHPDVVHIERQYGPDPRVVISSDLMADVPDTAVRLEVPPRVRLWPTDVASLLRGLAGLGLVTVEAEEAGSGQVVRMVRTRALQRGINAGVADPWAAAGELFGEREMATDSVGLKVVKESKLRSAKPFRPVDNPPVVVLAGKVLRKVASVRSPGDVAVLARWVVRGFRNVARRA
ncbi:MAG TPA: glycosyltransferase, partial [Chloroflexota bacterium]|nr:glycosyltransferase [Chloroflexota bacterium]